MSKSACNRSSDQQNRSLICLFTSMTAPTELDHTKFCYQIIVTISKICHVSRFLKLKDKIFRSFFASSEKKKKTFNCARYTVLLVVKSGQLIANQI